MSLETVSVQGCNKPVFINARKSLSNNCIHHLTHLSWDLEFRDLWHTPNKSNEHQALKTFTIRLVYLVIWIEYDIELIEARRQVYSIKLSYTLNSELHEERRLQTRLQSIRCRILFKLLKKCAHKYSWPWLDQFWLLVRLVMNVIFGTTAKHRSDMKRLKCQPIDPVWVVERGKWCH